MASGSKRDWLIEFAFFDGMSTIIMEVLNETVCK